MLMEIEINKEFNQTDCNNKHEVMTSEEFNDTCKADVIIKFFHSDLKRTPHIICYNKNETLRWFNNPDNIFYEWIPNEIGKQMSDTGIGGGPSKTKYIKLPDNKLITYESKELFIKGGLLKGIPVKLNERVGSGRIGATTTISGWHGQLPGYTIYQLIEEQINVQVLLDMIIEINQKIDKDNYNGIRKQSEEEKRSEERRILEEEERRMEELIEEERRFEDEERIIEEDRRRLEEDRRRLEEDRRRLEEDRRIGKYNIQIPFKEFFENMTDDEKNRITEITSKFISQLKDLPILSNLRILNISNYHSIKSFDGLPTFPNLEILHLSFSSLESFDGLPILPKLKKLVCQNNKLESFKGLPVLPELTQFACNNNEITSFKDFPIFPNLIGLFCSGNRIRKWDYFPDLPKLKQIIFDEYLNINNAPEYIKKLRR
jgi:hypothetical protein